MALFTTLVPSLVRVTVAFGITAPEESSTDPSSVPVTACALIVLAPSTSAISTPAATQYVIHRLCILPPKLRFLPGFVASPCLPPAHPRPTASPLRSFNRSACRWKPFHFPAPNRIRLAAAKAASSLWPPENGEGNTAEHIGGSKNG